MLFTIDRTKNRTGNAPCPEAGLLIEGNKDFPALYPPVYGVEIDSLNDFLEFLKKHNRLVVETAETKDTYGRLPGMPHIEIYDGYRE